MSKKVQKLNNSLFITVILGFSFLIAISYVFYLLNLNIANEKERLFTQISMEMEVNNSYFIPMHLNRPFWNHAFLFHCIQVVFAKSFSANIFVMRIPTLIFSVSLLLSVLIFFSRTFCPGIGILSTFILLLTPIFFHASHMASQDMFIAFCMTVAIFSFLHGYNYLSQSAKFYNQQVKKICLWYLVGFFFLIVGFFTLGMKFVILTFLIILPFFWWRMKLDFLYKNNTFVSGVILFLACVVAWYLLLNQYYDLKVLYASFEAQLANDLSWIKSKDIIPFFLISFLPWLFFLPQVFFFTVLNDLNFSEMKYERFISLFLVWWVIALILFGCLLKMDFELLTLQISVPMSVLIGLWLYGILNNKVDSLGLYTGIGFLLIVSISLSIYFFLKGDVYGMLIKEHFGLIEFVIFPMLFVGLAMAVSSSKYHISTAIYIYFGTIVMFFLCLSTYFLPKYLTYKRNIVHPVIYKVLTTDSINVTNILSLSSIN